MISNAFKGAYTERVQAENKVAGNIQAGIRDTASLTASIILGGIGLSEAKANAGIAESIAKSGTDRISGIGGLLVRALTGEKKLSAKARVQDKVANEGQDSLEPVFNEAAKLSRSEEEDVAIDTVWEILHRGKKVDSK